MEEKGSFRDAESPDFGGTAGQCAVDVRGSGRDRVRTHMALPLPAGLGDQFPPGQKLLALHEIHLEHELDAFRRARFVLRV